MVIADSGQGAIQAPQPVQASMFSCGEGIVPALSGNLMAAGSQASSQLRHMMP
jgi:hypothetical protein